MSSLLVLSSENACRGLLAEAILRNELPPGWCVQSAGVHAASSSPLTPSFMAGHGLTLPEHPPQTISSLLQQSFDLIILLSEDAEQACPLLPGIPPCLRWPLPASCAEPLLVAEPHEQLNDLVHTLRKRVRALMDSAVLQTLPEIRKAQYLILDNISEGVLVHDMQRRILSFNRAAESITGYNRQQVVNKDCHDVFPGSFCGGKCLFLDTPPPAFDCVKRQTEICTRSGERRRVDSTLRAMYNASGAQIGVTVVFRDITREENLAQRAGQIERFSGIIGRDKKMQDLFAMIRELTDSTAPVLIEGESGTGKELVAAAIHNEGPRANRQFIAVSCGALPETLLESELFGHVRGAFTGAIRDKKGRFELADGGTIFLDEIGDISPAVQVKLLRVLQEGTLERVGGEETIKVDVRVISATNRVLTDEITQGRFRDDLYYRLNVVPIFLPPLRERRNDIPLLAEHCLQRLLKEQGKNEINISPEAMDLMVAHDWPGNVRELQNWLQFALITCHENSIQPEHLPPSVAGYRTRSAPNTGPSDARNGKLSIATVRNALRQTDGNKVQAARALGVSRATLYRFLRNEKS